MKRERDESLQVSKWQILFCTLTRTSRHVGSGYIQTCGNIEREKSFMVVLGHVNRIELR